MTARTKRNKDARLKRDNDALELRVSGATYQEIQRALGFGSYGATYRAVERARDRTLPENAEALRIDTDKQLMRLLAACWHRAVVQRDLWAIDRALAIIDRRARLHGLDPPIQARVEVWDAEMVESAIKTIKGTLASLPEGTRPDLELPPAFVDAASSVSVNGHAADVE